MNNIQKLFAALQYNRTLGEGHELYTKGTMQAKYFTASHIWQVKVDGKWKRTSAARVEESLQKAIDSQVSKAVDEVKPLQNTLLNPVVKSKAEQEQILANIKANPSKKVAAVEYFKRKHSEPNVRTPFAGIGKFNVDTLFRAVGAYREVSEYLEMKLPAGETYISYVTDDPGQLEIVLNEGFWYGGEKYQAFYAGWKGMHGKAYLTRRSSGIRTLEDIGIHTKVEKASDPDKLTKYVWTVLADGYESMTRAKFVEFDNESGYMTFEINGNTRVGRVIELDQLPKEQAENQDGSLLLGSEMAADIGFTPMIPGKSEHRKGRLGDLFKTRFLTPFYLGKGNAQVVPHLKLDFVIFGSKRNIHFDDVIFGSLGPCKDGDVYTDAQSWDNFGFERKGLGVDLAWKFMLSTYEKATKSWKDLKKTFLRHVSQTMQAHLEEHGTVDYEGWLLLEAVLKGVPACSETAKVSIGNGESYEVKTAGFPGLFRRVYSYLMTRVLDCEKGRVPMNAVAGYGYVAPDPYGFDELGNWSDTRSKLKKGEIMIANLPNGTIVETYRQPNENSNAHYRLTSVYNSWYKAFRNKGVVLLGPGGGEVLERLGGGDMDDRLIYVYDPVWVAAFETLERYPETEKLSGHKQVEDTITLMGVYADDPKYQEMMSRFGDDYNPKVLNIGHAYDQIENARKQSAGIGPVVNACMIDNRLSKDRDRLLKDLDAKINEAKLNKQADRVKLLEHRAEWLKNRKPYQLAVYATNQELIIDGNQLNKKLLGALGDISETLKQFHKETLVYPYFATVGRTRPDGSVGRIPGSKQKAADYEVCNTSLCDSWQEIERLRKITLECFRTAEWLMVAPLSTELTSCFERDEEIVKIVIGNGKRKDDPEYEGGLRGFWFDRWTAYRNGDTKWTSLKEAYKGIEGEVEERLAEFDDNTLMEIAVELARRIYKRQYTKAEVGDEGLRKGFGDGLLWTRRLGRGFIAALTLAGLTGEYVPVELLEDRPEVRDSVLKVRVKDGMVIRISDDCKLGWPVKKVAEGEYLLDGGYLEVKKPSEALSPVLDDISEAVEGLSEEAAAL